MTQLMENSNANRPVAAPDDVIAKLPKEILEANCMFNAIPVDSSLSQNYSPSPGKGLCRLQRPVQTRHRGPGRTSGCNFTLQTPIP